MTAAHRRERRLWLALCLALAAALIAVTTAKAATSRTATQNQTPDGIQRPGMARSESPRSVQPSTRPQVPLHPVVLPSVAAIPVVVLPRAPRSVHYLTGRATWFATGPSGMFAAAGPALRVGDWRGRIVRVCGLSTCIRVMLNDWCQCSFRQADERAIDLSDEAFARLAPLSRGVLRVTVSW